MCSRNFVTSFAEDNKDKVLVDVDASLVVNHVNLSVLCLFVLCFCLYLCQSYRYKIRHKRDQIIVVISCMNVKIYKPSLVSNKIVIDLKYIYVKGLLSRLLRSISIW